jgi:ribose transport system substrate-binding protein
MSISSYLDGEPSQLEDYQRFNVLMTSQIMRVFRILSVAAVVFGLALLPACSRTAGKLKVAFITNNPYDFWKIAEHGTEKARTDFDVDVEFKMPSGGGSAEEQHRIIEDLLTRGVKGIAISPNDAANQTEYFKKVSAQVPLITQDSDLPDASARRCYIGTDNYKAGRAVGELIKKAAPEGGKIVIYVGKLDVQNAVERRQGVLDELAGKEKDKGEPTESGRSYGKYVLLDTMTDDGNSDKCQEKVADTLNKYKDVRCLIGLWEYNPPAILRAVVAQGKQNQVAIVGFDENDETLEGIKQGHIVGTVVQDPFNFGYLAVKILAGLARGDNSVLDKQNMDAEHRIYVPHRVITKENVEAFHAELNKLKGK